MTNDYIVNYMIECCETLTSIQNQCVYLRLLFFSYYCFIGIVNRKMHVKVNNNCFGNN